MEISLSRLQELCNGLKLEFERSQGSMVLLRSAADRSSYAPLLAELSAANTSYQELSPAQALTIEPGLQAGPALHCALHFPNDELGNCRQFAMLLKNAASKLGAQFNFNTCVDSITPAPTVTLSLNNGASQPSFDQVVVCTGAAYPALLEPLKLRLPMRGVRGYSLSLPVREPIHAPRSAVLDAYSRILITRLGNRVRVSGAAHLGGPSGHAQKKAVHSLYRAVQQAFPGSVQFAQPVQAWSGVRSMLPDGLPVLGDSGVPGVWLNLGHGASGWAMACGSARVLTALIGQQAPEIDIACLAARRFQR
jgi:D-amino-acid dehydrogenase